MITDVMILGLLVAEVVFLSRLDRRRFGTWVTPFTALGVPYAVVAVLAYFLAPIFDFVPLYTGSVVVWIAGLFILWGAGAFLGWALLGLNLAPNLEAAGLQVEPSRLDDDAATRWAVRLAWAAMPVMLYGVVVSARAAGGWSEIGSRDFKDAYSHGLHAHAVVLATLLAIFLVGIRRRGDRFLLATIAMLFVFISMGLVKGTIFQAGIGGIFFRMIRGRFRPGFKKVVLLLLSTYLVFNLVYLISLKIFTSDDPLNAMIYSYLGRHYLFYLFSGVLAFGEALRSGVSDIGGDWRTIFAPFINLYHFSFGNGALLAAGSTHEKGMGTDLVSDVGTDANVYTFFGTLHLYLGALGALLYVFVVGLLCYGFLMVVKKQNSVWLTASYCVIAAQLAVGFFEFYFWHLTSYEMVVMGLLLAVAFRSSFYAPARGQPAVGWKAT